MILWNSGSWIGIFKRTIRLLDSLFHFFCQIVCRISVSCPKPSYYTETGSLKFSYHILLNKLRLYYHLANLPIGPLGKEFWDAQDQNKSLPGLVNEMEPHLNALNITDLKTISKWSYKKIVKDYVFKLNRSELLLEIQGYKKLNYDELSRENFDRKQYFSQLNLEDARMKLRINVRLVPTILANYPSKYRRQGRSLVCISCSQSARGTPVTGSGGQASAPTSSLSPPPPSPDSPPIHSQSHLLSGECQAVSDLLEECDPLDDHSLALFFRHVMARNMEISKAEDN